MNCRSGARPSHSTRHLAAFQVPGLTEWLPFPRLPSQGFPTPPFSSKEDRPHDLYKSIQPESARQVCERSKDTKKVRFPAMALTLPAQSSRVPARARERPADPGTRGAQSRPSRGRREVWIGSASAEKGGEPSKRPRA